MRKRACIVLSVLLLVSMVACQSQANPDAAQSTARQESTAESTQTAAEQQPTDESTDPDKQKILVAYFSATGNTKPIAQTIAALTGGDLFEIVPADPYTEADLNYSDDACRANREQNDSTARPEISGTVENMDEYDIVFLGHPIWWGEEPRILDTFVESYDLSGKTIVHFCTSGGSEISAATENLKALTPGADWPDGHRFQTGADGQTIQTWLDALAIWN